MTALRRLNPTYLLASSLLLILPAISPAQQRPPIGEKLAKTYGLDSYGQIEAIRYNFSLQIPGLNISRSWKWEPKTGKVTYLRSQLSSQSDEVKKDIEPGFVNDNYWLLFPFHAYWDTGATITDEGMQKLPLWNGSAQKVAVKYPSDVGYTPGDTWELYVGSDG